MQQTNSENQNKNLPPDFITVAEMAKILSIARGTAYELTKTKGFPCFRIRKRVLIPLDPFSKWVKEQAGNQADILLT